MLMLQAIRTANTINVEVECVIMRAVAVIQKLMQESFFLDLPIIYRDFQI